MPRFAANLTTMFTEWAFLDRFAAAADAGFDAVEFLFPYDHPPEAIAGRLATHRLELALINGPPGDWAAGERGLASLPDRREAFAASLDTAMRYADILGARRIHVMAGNAPAGRHDTIACFAESLRAACDQAGGRGIEIVIEPINGVDMPGYFLNSFEQAIGLIETLGRDNLKLLFDIYHRQRMRGDVFAGLERDAPHIGHVQISSAPLRHEPNTGELNDFAVLRKLDLLGYRGFVGCEYRPAAHTLAGLGWRAAFAEESARRSGP